jgi:hypothetical protein
MRTTKIFPVFAPIQPRGRAYDKKTPNFREAYGQGGVYIIFKKQGLNLIPVYVGSSRDAGQQCARKFYPYKDVVRNIDGDLFNAEYRQRVSFSEQKKQSKFFVKFYLYGPSDTIGEEQRKEIFEKEYSLIRKLGPKYNTNLKTGKPVNKDFFEDEAQEAAEHYDEYKSEYQAAIQNDDNEPPF